VTKKQPDYVSYLLRLWRAKEKGSVVWRASLQSPQARERRGFANLDALFNFLRRQTGASLDSGEDEQHDHDDHG
jgi:hypothetical protein